MAGPIVRFDLHELAFEKIGLESPDAHGPNQGKAGPANDELAARGFCQGTFAVGKNGSWVAKYQKCRKSVASRKPTTSAAACELEKRGVGKKTASELVRKFGPQTIEEKIRLFDWHVSQGRSVQAGFLVSAIKEDYRVPIEPVTPSEQPSRIDPVDPGRRYTKPTIQRSTNCLIDSK